jgi:hypothetical protein
LRRGLTATVHIFEYWTRYDSVPHALLSVIFVLLTFVPPGLMVVDIFGIC